MGWCDCIYTYRNEGLLDLDEFAVKGRTYAEVMRERLGAEPGEDLRVVFAHQAGIPADSLPPWNLHWLGLFSDRKVKGEKTTMLDMMGDLMFEKLAFKPGELDLIVLFHDFEAVFPDGHKEHITSKLIDFGIPGGDSSMSRTVSLPAAIGAHMILTGKITDAGRVAAGDSGIYNPVLDELATMNIKCQEKTEAY